MINKIISFISSNRVSSTEVADCLGKSGAVKGVRAMNSGMFAVGKVRYIYGHSESNWTIHEQARYVCKDEIVVIDGIEVNDRALFGELITKFLILYREAKAIVALGNIRDANDIIKNRYPVWCYGTTPIGCFNDKIEASKEILCEAERSRAYYEGAVAVCDDTGVVLIPKQFINEEFYQKLEQIEEQEDIWFNCIDRLKWDTYDTVCLKKYLEKD